MPNEKILERIESRTFWVFYFLFLFPFFWFVLPFITIKEQNDLSLFQLLSSEPAIFNLIIILMSYLTGLFMIKKKETALFYAIATMALTTLYLLFSVSEYFHYPLFEKMLSMEGVAL